MHQKKRNKLMAGYRNGAVEMALLCLLEVFSLPLNQFLNNNPLKEPFSSLTW